MVAEVAAGGGRRDAPWARWPTRAPRAVGSLLSSTTARCCACAHAGSRAGSIWRCCRRSRRGQIQCPPYLGSNLRKLSHRNFKSQSLPIPHTSERPNRNPIEAQPYGHTSHVLGCNFFFWHTVNYCNLYMTYSHGAQWFSQPSRTGSPTREVGRAPASFSVL